MCIQSYSYLTNYREYTSSLIKTLILPLNCKKLKLFFQNEAPRIKPHPKDHSQCSRRASVSRVWLHRPGIQNISYHSDCDTSRLLLGNKSSFNIFASTKPHFQDLLLAFGIFLMFFIFRRQVAWNRPHFHFSVLAINHPSKQE